MSSIEITERDLKFIRLASKAAADLIPHAGARVSAILAIRDEVLSFGFNSGKTHPFQAKYCKNPHALFWHAETHAIKNAIHRGHKDLLKRSSLYVLRLSRTGKPALSMPCSGCFKAIVQHNIQRVLYTTGEFPEDSNPVIKHLTFNGVAATN